MIYIDSEYRCHPTNPDGVFREVNEPFFDDKCTDFIEGFCYDDIEGVVKIYAWKPYDELDAAQRDYEREKLADAENALAILLGGEST